MVNSISHGNGTNFANFGAGGQVVRCNGGFAGTNGNVNVDPRFVNQAGGDLHLQASSPMIDAGTNGVAGLPATDVDGQTRIQDGNGDNNAVVDIGADEVPHP